MANSRVFGLLFAAALGLSACGRDAPQQESAPSTEYMHPVGQLSEADAMLFRASGSGDTDGIEEALELGANPNVADRIKRTPLFGAAFLNRHEAAKLLVERGAQVNVEDESGLSPLHAAVVAGGKEVAEVLIGAGAVVDERSLGGRTALHLAAATNQPAIVDLLLAKGANPRLKDGEGLTPAGIAARNGHAELHDRIKRRMDADRPGAGH